MRPIHISFAIIYPVRRRTTGSIFRKAAADSSAAAFRFSEAPSLKLHQGDGRPAACPRKAKPPPAGHGRTERSDCADSDAAVLREKLSPPPATGCSFAAGRARN
jgi:hypothetical protein